MCVNAGEVRGGREEVEIAFVEEEEDPEEAERWSDPTVV